MKTFYLTTLLLTLGISATAQTQKGTLNINGQFGRISGGQYYKEQFGLTKSFSIQLNPNVGYFVMDSWEVGGGILFGMAKSHYNGNPDKISSNSLGLKIYSKYYFGKGAVKPYVTAGSGYDWLTSKTRIVDGRTYVYKTDYLSAEGGAGVAWFASPNIGLFSQITYDRRWSTYNSSGLLNLNFGVQINLRKKK